MSKLTKAQERALQQIRAKGVFYAYDGISRATVAALARQGLVTVDWSVRSWTNRRSGRNHSQCDWTARATKEL